MQFGTEGVTMKKIEYGSTSNLVYLGDLLNKISLPLQ